MLYQFYLNKPYGQRYGLYGIKQFSCNDDFSVTLIMLGYDCYAISTNFGEVNSNLAQADDVGGAQVAMGVLAIASMLALLLCYCLFEPTETAINRGKVHST